MADDLNARIDELNTALSSIEVDMARRETPPPGLSEFKEAVDQLRGALIGMISAAHASDRSEAIARQRAQHAGDLCHNLLADVIDGTLAGDTPEFRECYDMVSTLNFLLNE